MLGSESQETSTATIATAAGELQSSPDRPRGVFAVVERRDSKPNRRTLTRPRTVELVAEARLPTDFGEFRIAGYRSLNSGEEFVALSRGELSPERPTLVRIHSQCMTGDVFGSVRCDCGRHLRAAMELI